MVESKRSIVQRRGILAGVATVVAGALARLTAQPVQAGIDGDLVLNTSNTGTATTTLQSQAAGGGGYNVLRITNFRIADAIQAEGGPGSLGNTGGRGINATGGNNDSGSFATPSSGGDAILGTGGNTLSAVGNGGRGVRGTGGAAGSGTGGTGVEGTGGTPNGVGVRGTGGGSAGSQGAGMVAITNSTSNAALQADNNGAGPGVLGESTSGFGVLGRTTAAGTGVRGESTTSIGVHGTATSGTAVRAEATSGVAVLGTATGNGIGLWGIAVDGIALLGTSTTGIGLSGSTSENNVGVFGSADGPGKIGAIGLVGRSVAGTGVVGQGATAARFDGPVIVNGSFTVSGGPKSAAVRHPDGDYRRMYCQESPEPWFEDFGTAELKNGRAEVTLDPEFDAIVRGDDYLIFLTPEGDSRGLFISRKEPHRFVVEEQQGGKSNLSFSYRVVSRRRDDVGRRLEKVTLRSGRLGEPVKLPDLPDRPRHVGIPGQPPTPGRPEGR